MAKVPTETIVYSNKESVLANDSTELKSKNVAINIAIQPKVNTAKNGVCL